MDQQSSIESKKLLSRASAILKADDPMMLALLDDDLLDIDDDGLIEDSPLLDSEAINSALLKVGDFSNLTGLEQHSQDMMSPVKDEDLPHLPTNAKTASGDTATV